MRRLCLLFLLPVLLCSCSTPETLAPRSAAVPAGIDFSGQWKLRPESGRGQPGIGEAIDRTDGVDNRSILRETINRQRAAQSGRPGSGKTRGGLVGIFLETGEFLRITQTAYALYISFDRAIVEEYGFGENRPISIGQADAHRVSGWDGNDYVIETLGENGMKLTDRYSLSGDSERMTRRITLRSREMEEVTVLQEFDRH